MHTIRELVSGYYSAVDAGDIDNVVERFAVDACYVRGGYPPIRGAEELRSFYTGVRIIKVGEHTIEQVLVEGHTAAVTGTFAGQSHTGEPLQVAFADFFEFADGLVQHRTTYFLTKGV